MFNWILAAGAAALLWYLFRRKVALWRKIVFGLPVAGIAVYAVLAIAGMQLERKGDGVPSFVTFDTPAKRAERVEADRAAEQPSAPPQVVQAAAAAPLASSWPSFRGPNNDGVVTENILTNWPGGKLKQLWKKPVGAGWASFVAAGNLIYTIEQRRAQEVVAAYDAATGKEIWTHKYIADFQESMGGPGPRATPTYHDGKIYSLGATGEFFVLDALTGKVVWQKNILTENGAENITWAMSASPLIVDDMVIVQPGGSNNRSIVAYNKTTGARVWTSLGDRQSYTTPMLVTLDGKRQILTATATRVVGLDPASGKLLWDYPWTTDYDINSSQPILVGPSRFVISAGYGHGAALVDVAGGAAKTVWENKKLKNKFNSSVILDGYIYGFDEAIFTCINAATGETAWKGGRYGYGQVLLASGHLVITSEEGEVVLLKADPKAHTEVAKFQSLEGRTWNVPMIAGGRLFVRNAAEMAAYSIAP
jgi:outer membrane protein assembly factor BamB